jgi:lipopolysaccharide/colanic/teichoic acid biosynthesis glycosyltransferase
MSRQQAVLKRSFDFCAAALGLMLTSWILIPAFVLSCIDTKSNGLFIQTRVGRYGKLFPLIKLKSMKNMPDIQTSVTTDHDPRITVLGRFWRKTKIDELPQLINVLLGHMSCVGPRPDVPGFADQLQGDDRCILSVRPGITGPASLKYRHEEKLLVEQEDPEAFNARTIWPDKVRINREYVENFSFVRDMVYIWRTLVF